MSIFAAPGTTITATAGPTTTGLTGTIAVRILTHTGGTFLARTTTGITESPAGSGLYAVDVTTPTTAGSYRIVWDTGGGTPTYAEEDLSVTSSTGVTAGPSGSDLCSIAQVREWLQKPVADTAQDAVIQAAITRASGAISRYCEREFAPVSTGVTRTFEAEIINSGLLDLAPYDLRAATAVVIDTDQVNPIALSTDEWRYFPQPARDGTYTMLRLQPLQRATGRVMWRFRQLKITGDWGFASVPVDVQHAAIITSTIWVRRDVAAFSTTYKLNEDTVERPESLPSQVRGTLDLYRRKGF